MRGPHVTAALLTATHYTENDRILPAGFDKSSASPGCQHRRPRKGASRPQLSSTAAAPPTRYENPCLCGPIPHQRGAPIPAHRLPLSHNLAPYKADEPQPSSRVTSTRLRHSLLLFSPTLKVLPMPRLEPRYVSSTLLIHPTKMAAIPEEDLASEITGVDGFPSRTPDGPSIPLPPRGGTAS